MMEITSSALLSTVRDAANDAATAYVNGAAPDLPPISWTYGNLIGHYQLRGYISQETHDDAAAVAEQWRAAFGITAPYASLGENGLRQCCGETALGETVLWYIADPDAWERRCEQRRAQSQESRTA